jgi:hypothetical protein
MNKITDYRRGGVHPRPFGCNHQGVEISARDSGQPQGIQGQSQGIQGQPQGIAPTGVLHWFGKQLLASIPFHYIEATD